MKHSAKKILFPVIAALMLAMIFLCLSSCSDEDKGPFVYVSVADQNGNIVAQYEKVAFAEGMTVDGALQALHEAKCKGGYASSKSEYGISMTKLWGVENGGAYGYYVNNSFPESLADELSENDHVYAFIYTDTVNFSDKLAFFNTEQLELGRGEQAELTLFYTGYDESWMPFVLPVANAEIYIDGERAELSTDGEGRVSIVFEKKGEYTVTARSEEITLVPPFVKVIVK